MPKSRVRLKLEKENLHVLAESLILEYFHELFKNEDCLKTLKQIFLNLYF